MEGRTDRQMRFNVPALSRKRGTNQDLQANSENCGPPLGNKFDLEVGSKVTVKVTTWYHRKGLVTKNTHAKYQSSTCNSAEVMAKVKVFVTDRQTEGRTEGRTDRRMRFNVPALSRKRGTTITRCKIDFRCKKKFRVSRLIKIG